jgi:hypothetical protein
VDERIFFNIDNRFLRKIDREKKIAFITPFQKNIFCSPEIKDISTIPSFVSQDYYSLASLAFFSFFNHHFTNETKSHLETIRNTKLYYFLKRLIIEKERKLLFI